MRLTITVTAALAAAPLALAQNPSAPFGTLSEFDLWASGALDLNHVSIPGRVGAHKWLSMTNFAVATDPTYGAFDDTIVSGGNLTLANGVVQNGQAVYEQTLDLAPTVAFRDANQPTRVEDLLDENAMRALMADQSISLGLLPPNGDLMIAKGVLFLTGNQPGLNVFLLHASDLEGLTAIKALVPQGSAVLLNVEGGTWAHFNWGLHIDGVPSSRVLVNAFQASSIALAAVNFDATLLAYRGVVRLDWLQVDGQVFARMVDMEHCGTTHSRLYGSEFVASSARFGPDEDGADVPGYTIVLQAENKQDTLDLVALDSQRLEARINGVPVQQLRRSAVTRVAAVGFDPQNIAPFATALGVTVESTKATPVAFDDRTWCGANQLSVTADVLANDLPGSAGLDPASVTVSGPPLAGSVSVDPATGRITWSRLPGQAVPRLVTIWYQVADLSGAACQPRRLLIAQKTGRGLGER